MGGCGFASDRRGGDSLRLDQGRPFWPSSTLRVLKSVVCIQVASARKPQAIGSPSCLTDVVTAAVFLNRTKWTDSPL